MSLLFASQVRFQRPQTLTILELDRHPLVPDMSFRGLQMLPALLTLLMRGICLSRTHTYTLSLSLSLSRSLDLSLNLSISLSLSLSELAAAGDKSDRPGGGVIARRRVRPFGITHNGYPHPAPCTPNPVERNYLQIIYKSRGQNLALTVFYLLALTVLCVPSSLDGGTPNEPSPGPGGRMASSQNWLRLHFRYTCKNMGCQSAIQTCASGLGLCELLAEIAGGTSSGARLFRNA